MPARADSRHELGQWFTPPAVADLVIRLTAPSEGGTVFDPTCGDGVFLERARALGHRRVRGLDIDPGAVSAARARFGRASVDHGSIFDPTWDGSSASAIVGNPPYVRQERIDKDLFSAASACLQRNWPDVPELLALGRRADLAAMCVARMLAMVRPGGTVGLVVSSALFDTDSARTLWRGIAKVASIEAIVESPDERWFGDAAVNASIVILRRGAARSTFPIARLRQSVADVASRATSIEALADVAEVRMAESDKPEAWPSILRAPKAWFDLRSSPGAWAALGDLASIRRGATTGANGVFYLERNEAVALGIEAACLQPLVRSPRESGADAILIDPDATPTMVLSVPATSRPESSFPNAWRYLDSHRAVADRPTLRAREPWWSLNLCRAHLFLTKAYAARFVQRFSAEPLACDQRLYAVLAHSGADEELLAAVLNSTFTAFALESLGRASLGEGALEWTVADAKTLPIADARDVPGDLKERVVGSFRAMCSRAVGTVDREAVRADRAALDTAVAEMLGPGFLELLPGVHQALIESAARRGRKAAS